VWSEISFAVGERGVLCELLRAWLGAGCCPELTETSGVPVVPAFVQGEPGDWPAQLHGRRSPLGARARYPVGCFQVDVSLNVTAAFHTGLILGYSYCHFWKVLV